MACRRAAKRTGVLERAGDQVVADIVVVNEPSEGGTLVGRVFLSDGITPASGFTVFAGSLRSTERENSGGRSNDNRCDRIVCVRATTARQWL